MTLPELEALITTGESEQLEFKRSPATISLAIFSDRLELWSEGGLPFGLEPEALKGDHASRPRNLRIADVFFRRGLIERWGRGTQVIVEECERAGCTEPSYQMSGGCFVVTFPLRAGQGPGSKPESGPGSKPEPQLARRVLLPLEQEPLGKAAIAEALGHRRWTTVSLGEVASMERRSLAPEEIASGTNYLGLEHIESGGRIIKCQRVEGGVLKSNKFAFDPGTLLYGKLRPYLAKVCIPDREGCCSTDIIPIRPGKHLDIGYLRHLLLWKPYVDMAASLCSGANLPRISPSTLLSIEIPLPPLEEQRRIAAILDQARNVESLAAEQICES